MATRTVCLGSASLCIHYHRRQHGRTARNRVAGGPTALDGNSETISAAVLGQNREVGGANQQHLQLGKVCIACRTKWKTSVNSIPNPSGLSAKDWGQNEKKAVLPLMHARLTVARTQKSASSGSGEKTRAVSGAKQIIVTLMLALMHLTRTKGKKK